MSYYSNGKEIKETTQNKTVAVAAHESGAGIIIKALNYYFGEKTFTSNEAIEMMHKSNADAFKKVADFCHKKQYTAEMIIDYLKEIAEEIEAQMLVVSMRDELKFGSPNDL